MTGIMSSLLSSLLLLVILIVSPVSLTDAQTGTPCDKLHQCDFYWGDWSQCSATCSGVRQRSATVCCPPTSSTLQLCRARCHETFELISSLRDSAPCRCVNGGVRSASGACDCPPGFYGNCCQEKITYPDTDNTNYNEEEGQPGQQHDGCHGSHEHDEHHPHDSDGGYHHSCEDDNDDGHDSDDKSDLEAGAIVAIIIVVIGCLVATLILAAVLCHKKRATSVAAASIAARPVAVVKPPEPAVYTIDVKQKTKTHDDVTVSPPPYWQAIDASAPPSYQSYLALNEVGLDRS